MNPQNSEPVKPSSPPTPVTGQPHTPQLKPDAIYPVDNSAEVTAAIAADKSGDATAKSPLFKRIIKKSGTTILTLLFLASPLLVVAFIIQSYQVDGQSMETTLQNNDRLLVDKLPRSLSRLTHQNYIPERGNIIIFNQSGLFDSAPGQQKQLIKRVIGLPGEHVVIKNNVITIYNKDHPGGFNPDKSGIYTIAAKQTPGDIDLTLKANELFVCGDNRLNSEDSRYFGPIEANNIVGKLVMRIVPVGKIEKF